MSLTVPELKALIFDVDGTLADTERDGHRIAFDGFDGIELIGRVRKKYPERMGLFYDWMGRFLEEKES